MERLIVSCHVSFDSWLNGIWELMSQLHELLMRLNVSGGRGDILAPGSLYAVFKKHFKRNREVLLRSDPLIVVSVDGFGSS